MEKNKLDVEQLSTSRKSVGVLGEPKGVLGKPEEEKAEEIAAAGNTELEMSSVELSGTVYCITPRSPKAPQSKCSSLEESFQDLKVIPSSKDVQQFVQTYKKQYGEPSLDFYLGDLKSAYEVVSNQPADEKKVLAIYLHHSGSILTNSLCQKVLKNDDVLTTFNNLFIVYGCDMSNTTDASSFYDQLKDIISVEAAEAAKNLELDQMPAFLIIGQPTDGEVPNIAVIYGDYDDDTLQTRLQLEYSLLSGLYD